MSKLTRFAWNSFKQIALASLFLALLAGAAAAFTVVAPASAASLRENIDTGVAVFVVPLTLLVAITLFEVGRVVWRGNLPGEAPRMVRASRYWKRGGNGV